MDLKKRTQYITRRKQNVKNRFDHPLKEAVQTDYLGRISILGSYHRNFLANFAISRTPIAAEYRAALSISYLPMLLESLLSGLIIGFCVSYFLLRFFDKIPTRNPMLKSIILSFIVLIIVTIIIEVPASFLTTTGDASRYFLIGAMFNVLRILALGIVIGYLYKRLYKGFNPSVTASGAAKRI